MVVMMHVVVTRKKKLDMPKDRKKKEHYFVRNNLRKMTFEMPALGNPVPVICFNKAKCITRVS